MEKSLTWTPLTTAETKTNLLDVHKKVSEWFGLGPEAKRHSARKTPRVLPDTAFALSYRVADAETVTGISRTTLYELIAAGKLPDVKIAGCRLIPSDALKRLVTAGDGAAGDSSVVLRQKSRVVGRQ